MTELRLSWWPRVRLWWFRARHLDDHLVEAWRDGRVTAILAVRDGRIVGRWRRG